MFRRKTLAGILTAFDKVSAQLERHVDKKAQEQFSLFSERAAIDEQIDANTTEIDRADRVLAKVQELIS